MKRYRIAFGAVFLLPKTRRVCEEMIINPKNLIN